MEKISGTKYLSENVKRLTEGLTPHQTYMKFNVSGCTHKKVINGEFKTLSLTVVQKYSLRIGIGFAELFLNPEVAQQYKAWYGESELGYFSQNFDDAVSLLGYTYVELAEKIGRSKNVVGGYASGMTYPRVGDLDRIAEVLGMELADLFLP